MSRAKPQAEPWTVHARYVTSNVRALRAAAGWTQERLAAEADIDWKYLQQIEAGATNLTLRTLVAIARAFHVDPRRLLDPAPMPEPRPRGRPPAGGHVGTAVHVAERPTTYRKTPKR